MKLAVIGNRNLTDRRTIENTLNNVVDSIPSEENIVFLLGGAAGVQEVTKDWCAANKFDYVLFKPWHLVDTKLPFSPHLFFLRNKQIVDNATQVLILRNGTDDSEVSRVLDYCDKKGKTCIDMLVDSEAKDAA